jgi:hypothetical protein
VHSLIYSVAPSSVEWSELGSGPPFPTNESAWSALVTGSQSHVWHGPYSNPPNRGSRTHNILRSMNLVRFPSHFHEPRLGTYQRCRNPETGWGFYYKAFNKGKSTADSGQGESNEIEVETLAAICPSPPPSRFTASICALHSGSQWDTRATNPGTLWNMRNAWCFLHEFLTLLFFSYKKMWICCTRRCCNQSST